MTRAVQAVDYEARAEELCGNYLKWRDEYKLVDVTPQ